MSGNARFQVSGFWLPSFVLFVVFVVSLAGCAAMGPPTVYKDGANKEAATKGFWDQKVRLTGFGITLISPWGPMTFGYVNWERNTEEQTSPEIVKAVALLAGQGFAVTPPPPKPAGAPTP